MSESIYRIIWTKGGTSDVLASVVEFDEKSRLIYLKDEAGFILHVFVPEHVSGIVKVDKIAS